MPIKVRKIIKSNEGVVGIVVAILLIGLMVSVVSLIQMAYVPKWMEQKEAEHMDEVASQFSQLKFAVDTQASTEQLDTPIATSITLGSKEMQFLMSVRAFGHLEILSDVFTITLINSTNTSTVNIGTIKYSSANAYFIDQSYIYEGGAIIVSQTEGNIISIKPSISVQNDSGDLTFLIKVANVTGIGGKDSSSGYGTAAIQTEYVGYDEINMTDVDSINITTSYPNAWNTFLYWFFDKELISTYANISRSSNYVVINFEDPDAKPEINLKLVNINAQIGAGWIE